MRRLLQPKVLFFIALSLGLMVLSKLYLPVALPHIQVAPEAVFRLGPVPITNTLLALLASDVVLIGLAFLAGRNLQMVPGRLQNFFETIIEFWKNTAEGHLGEKLARTWLPVALTVFFSIWFSNYLHFLPGFDSVGYFCEPADCPKMSAEVAPVDDVAHGADAAHAEGAAAEEGGHDPLFIDWTGGASGQGIGLIQPPPDEVAAGDEHGGADAAHAEGEHLVFVPFLRVASSDLNFTLALALIAFFCIEFAGFKKLGAGYLGKFFNFKTGAMNMIVGLLEAFSEVMRIVTFSFRLFGNVFAGQTMLFVFPFLIPLLVVLPIYGLELFVGLIQAYVFAILILAFMEQAVTAHHGDEHH